MAKNLLNEELKRMKVLSGMINENDQEEYTKKQLQRVGEEPTPEEMANIMAAMQKNEETLEEAIEGGLTYDELPEKVKDYFRRNITMSVAFVKKDGSVRHMAFRRNLKSYEKSDKEKSEKQSNVLINNNLMNVYDTNKFIQLKRETGDDAQAARGSFRNFRLDNVLAFLVGGQLFDMRDQNQIKERFGEEVYASLTPSMIASLKSDEAKGSEEIPPYEGPENPMDNQVAEVMIQEGQLGKVIARMLIEEVLKEGLDDEYNYDNTKDNPRTIVVKFAPGGEDKFWNQYIKSTDPSYYRGLGENWHYFQSWWDLTHDGLKMMDGWYYALYKLYEPEVVNKWHQGGRRGDLEQETYFINYNKESGEINIWSSREYNLEAGKRHEFSELKSNSISHTYCRLEGPNGESRLATIGSKDHRGYFEVVGVDGKVAEVMIQEGQLGKAITKMLIEEMLKEAHPLEGGPGYMTKYRAGVIAQLISRTKAENISNFSDENKKLHDKAIKELEATLEALKAEYREETGEEI